MFSLFTVFFAMIFPTLTHLQTTVCRQMKRRYGCDCAFFSYPFLFLVLFSLELILFFMALPRRKGGDDDGSPLPPPFLLHGFAACGGSPPVLSPGSGGPCAASNAACGSGAVLHSLTLQCTSKLIYTNQYHITDLLTLVPQERSNAN